MELSKEDLSKYLVPGPPTAYYIPNFITSDEEEFLMKRVYEAPRPKWTQLSNRRLQNWGGIPHVKGMIAESLPKWLEHYVQKVGNLNVFNGIVPNHVLVNEYLPGQGIMPHSDGPLFYPTITTISCGSHTVLQFSRKLSEENNRSLKVFVEPRSLLVVQDELYGEYLHSIEEMTSDVITDDVCNVSKCAGSLNLGVAVERGVRLSFTIRHVPKTSKLKLKLGR